MENKKINSEKKSNSIRSKISLNNITKSCLFLLTFLLPLFTLPYTFKVLEFNKFYLLLFLTSIGFVCWLARFIFKEKIRIKKSPIHILALPFLGILGVSAILSVDKIFSLFGFYPSYSQGILAVFLLVLVYFLAADLKDREIVSKLIFTFILSSFLVCIGAVFSIVGIWQKFLGLSWLGNSFNTIGSLGSLSIFLVVLTCLTIGYLMEVSSKSKGKILFLLGTLGLSLFLLVGVGFRPALILLFVGLALFLVLGVFTKIYRRNINRLLLPISLLIILGLVLVFNVSLFRVNPEPTLPLETSWEISLEVVKNNLKFGALGSGPGTYFYDFLKFKSPEFNETSLWALRFHRSGSHLSEILATAGFAGLIIWLALILVSIWKGFLTFLRRPQIISILVIFLVLSLAQILYYQNMTLAFSFWLFLGLLVARTKSSDWEISFRKIPETRLIFGTLVILSIVGFVIWGFFAVKYWRAESHYLESKNSPEISQEISQLEKAVNLHPNFSRYKLDLSRAYLNRALQEIQKPSEEVNQSLIGVFFQRAISYGKGAESDQVKIEGVVEISPNWIAGWENLGLIYRELIPFSGQTASKAFEESVKAFNRALELEPANSILYTELGKIYSSQGDTNKAKTNFEKALELKPDYLDARIQEAMLLEEEGNSKEAISQMEGAVADNPSSLEARFQLGRLYFNQGEIDQAITQFEKVIEINPDHSNSLFSLGMAYEKKGMTSKAISYFEKVLEINPDNSEVAEKIDELKGGKTEESEQPEEE